MFAHIYLRRLLPSIIHQLFSQLRCDFIFLSTRRCELLVVGGGSGGCSMAAKYASKMGAQKVVIVEPNDVI